LAEATRGVLGSLDTDSDGLVDATADLPSAKEVATASWVDPALPDLLASTRRHLILELVSQGLDLETLQEASAMPGGFQVVVGLLRFKSGAASITEGESLKLAMAVMRRSSSSSSSPSSSQQQAKTTNTPKLPPVAGATDDGMLTPMD
jgi:hypothetical protein